MPTRHHTPARSHHKAHEPHPAPPERPDEPPAPPEVDVPAVIEHLLDAMGHMARQLGSPPDALAALAAARELLGKES